MRFLLTGGTGLVGSAVLRRLLDAGHRVAMATSSVGVESGHEGLTVFPWSLDETVPSTRLLGELAQCDGIVHAAAVLTAEPPRDIAAEIRLYQQNLFGSQTLMAAAAAAAAGVRSFVYISTKNLFGPETVRIAETTLPSPPSFYAASKLAGEHLAALFDRNGKTAFCSLRISAPYGPRYRTRSVIPLFLENARSGVPLTLMGSGSRKQVFTYVDDIAGAVIRCLETSAHGVYNITGPRAVTMEELARAVLAVVPDTGSRIEWTGQPDPQEARDIAVDISHAREALGWSPAFDIMDGLAAMAGEWTQPTPPPYRLIR